MKNRIGIILFLTLGFSIFNYFQSDLGLETKLSADQAMTSNLLRHDGPSKFAAIHSLIRTRVDEEKPAYKIGDQLEAYRRAMASSTRTPNASVAWKERGPANVGGRTHGLLVDPDDNTHQTWFVGSVGGGVWKTADGGESWELLTEELTNLSTSTLAMSAINTNVIYAGTGEGFGNIDGIIGTGIWKSTDKGQSWSVLASTVANQIFANVTRLIVNPANENEITATTIGEFNNGGRTSYVMSSIDGGDSWFEQYSSTDGRIQQIVYTMDDYHTQYATINSVGIIQTFDGGAQWDQVFYAQSFGIRRMEMAISRQDAGVIYISGEGNAGSRLIFTRDTFRTLANPIFEGQDADWLSGQGWYDNTIAVHPYNDSLVWVAGAGAMLQIQPGTKSDTIKVFDQYVNHTDYLAPIDNSFFNLESAGHGLDLFQGLPFDPELTIEDLVDVIVYFGPGRSQKAHLFDVDLFSSSFDYNSMIDVPFEVYDTTNNRQISISIFDVSGDGMWTFEDYRNSPNPFHDVVLLNTINYSDTGNIILQTANPLLKAQYYFYFQPDTSFQGTVDDFIDGSVAFLTRIEQGLVSQFTPITDGYFEYVNVDAVGSKGVHVDHHNIIFIPLEDSLQSFYVLNANDGGLAFSQNNGQTFKQTGETFNDGSFESLYGYNVSQFYGIDKMNRGDRYIGGTQDNGSWISPRNPDETTNWISAPSGDGFEAAWNYRDTNQILETSQFNGLFK